MIYSLIILIEPFEQIIIVDAVQHSACLSNRMHCPHRSSNINSFYACFAADDRTNCWSTSRVILYYKFLDRDFGFLGYYLENWGRNNISWISLIKICFYNNPFIYAYLMSRMVLLAIIWMNSVSHISWNKKWPLNCFLKAI